MGLESNLNTRADFKRLFETAPGLYLVLTSNLHILAASDAYLLATMTKREEIIGKHLFAIFPDNPGDDSATGVRNLRASLKRVLQLKKPDTMAIQKYDIRKPESQGGEFEERYWSPLNAPVLDENGDVEYVIHRVEDVTEFVRLKKAQMQEAQVSKELRSRAEKMEAEVFQRSCELDEVNQQLRTVNQELKIANGDLEAFTYSVSHDIKGPLRIMQGFAHALLHDHLDKLDQEARECVVHISTASAKVIDLVRDLLAFSQLSRTEIALEPLTVRQVIADVVRQLPADVGIRELKIEIPNSLPAVLGHYVTLAQVLMNLISNGTKFVRPSHEAEITISAEKAFDYIRISVQDNGIGIAPEHQERIFNVFERLEVNDEQYPGTGIGLAIVKRGVERMAGHFGVESGLGMGSKFWIELPVSK